MCVIKAMRHDQTSSSPDKDSLEDVITRKLGNLCRVTEERLLQGEAFIQEEPSKAVAYAVGAGYLLRYLPLRSMLRGVVRTLAAALWHAAILYGAAKIMTLLRQTGHLHAVPRSLNPPRV
jgi:hypothetical protein